MAATRHAKKFVDFQQNGASIVLSNIYPGEIVIAGGLHVIAAFNGTPTYDVGFVKDGAGGSAAPQALASALVPTAVGAKPFDELSNTGNVRVSVADQIVGKLNATSPTTGKGILWAEILSTNPLNDDI